MDLICNSLFFFVFFNAFSEICKETTGQVDFSLLRNRPILGRRISAAGRTNVFSSFVRKNVFDEICKETIGQMDFSLLRDRPILAPGNFGTVVKNVF